jgi:hypothetical protein
MADDRLREPVEQTLTWVRDRLTEVLAEGRDAGEFVADLDPATTAATLLAVLQGGYVLARAARSAAPFDAAVDGALTLLSGRRVR